MDSLYHPPQIAEFLRREQKLVDSIGPSIEFIIEVGCMDGRYLEWAISHKKRYVGIDVVKRHIQLAQRVVAERGLSAEVYQFVHGDAQEILHLLELERLQVEGDRGLFFFPFNSFGNMPHVGQLLCGLQKNKTPFLISSYQTNEYATACRLDYYTRCMYRGISVSSDETGVCVSSLDGLRTIAYHPKYLKNLCTSYGLSVKAIADLDINLAYMTDTLLVSMQRDGVVPYGFSTLE